MTIKTADLCDQFVSELKIADSIFKNYGAEIAFNGKIATVKVFEDNVLVRQILETPGEGRVLVIDGGGSLRRALIGATIAKLALKNNWAGLLIYGSVRDVEDLAKISLPVKALNSNPWRPNKAGWGEQNIPVTFASVTFTPGHYLYGDEDGVVVASRALA